MKHLGKFNVSSEVDFQLMEIDGEKYVLKTGTSEEVLNEKFFMSILQKHNIPSLVILEHPELAVNQMLMEYVEGSPTLDKHLTTEAFHLWGATVKAMHSIHLDTIYTIDGEGKEHVMSWKEYLLKRIDASKKKRALGDKKIELIKQHLQPLLLRSDFESSLLHGDLHSNNAILRNKEIVLFDKSPYIVAGDPAYDLVIVCMNFPAGTYIKTDDPEYAHDAELLAAFIDGYGKAYFEENKEIIDMYILLRSFERYPNKHEPFLGEIIDSIL